MQNVLPERKHPVHPPNIHRFNAPVIVFVTVCTKSRRPILANAVVNDALRDCWPQARQWSVGRYIIMPDHVHFFCSPAVAEAESVRTWVAYWKRLVSCKLPDLKPLWQRDCWDTQLRSGTQYADKWEYVRLNPVRKGLIADVDAWPYQGELNVLWW